MDTQPGHQASQINEENFFDNCQPNSGKKVGSYPALVPLAVPTDLESELVREIIETVNL